MYQKLTAIPSRSQFLNLGTNIWGWIIVAEAVLRFGGRQGATAHQVPVTPLSVTTKTVRQCLLGDKMAPGQKSLPEMEGVIDDILLCFSSICPFFCFFFPKMNIKYVSCVKKLVFLIAYAVKKNTLR